MIIPQPSSSLRTTSTLRAKHMELKYLSVKEEVQKQRVFFEHIRTDVMIADPLTKGLPPKAFIGHVERMGIINKALPF